MSEPFTIRIFVPDGDPEGIRFIDRMNWTGLGIAFPRSDWPNLKGQDEVRRTGVYILVGYSDSDPDLPKLYIGQGDDISGRLESHFRKKGILGLGSMLRVKQWRSQSRARYMA